MTRVFNFSAGPAALPEPVLQQAAAEMTDWRGSGMSVMEMSHRGKEFMSILAETKALLIELLNIPANYKVLFMQGGALGQNAILPMNLLRGRTSADYVHTGEWSKKSIEEAGKYCRVRVAATAEASRFTHVPPQGSWDIDPHAAYVHICSNETIGGVEYHWTPDTGDVPLVADMSSNILSKPVDVSRYGLIYAGAQKNIGPAGLTLVIVREDLLGGALPITPQVFDYQHLAANDSMINTPPTYAIYIAGLVFQWIKDQGGLEGMARKILPVYFRSQRQIIIDTEALVAQQPSLAHDAFVDKSDQIGNDQRLLRLRYGQFLGEEQGHGAPHAPGALGAGHDDGDETSMAESEQPAESQAVLEAFGHTHDIAGAATTVRGEPT